MQYEKVALRISFTFGYVFQKDVSLLLCAYLHIINDYIKRILKNFKHFQAVKVKLENPWRKEHDFDFDVQLIKILKLLG